ncbi:sugar ABC transporter ATP-binding protein, partial [Streptomyces sp. McG8]|nr:sugar ABC transporter ATP-binding protein [Streptomyces sp. McG8]
GVRRRRREGGTVLERLRERAGALRAGAERTAPERAGAVATLDGPGRPDLTAVSSASASAEPRLPGDLIVRTTPDIRLRHGMQVPLLVDLAHLFVFDQHGRRICPSPERLPDLEE